ncbi:hypothetical protein EI94DRAFT_639887 [Lactarius quietus]|nr:hypothetical protein EI94DRAFT_639887 [Lactarius quietus]
MGRKVRVGILLPHYRRKIKDLRVLLRKSFSFALTVGLSTPLLSTMLSAGCALTACLLAAASSFTGFIVDFTTTINIHILLPQLVSFNTYAYNPTRLILGLSPLSSSSSSVLLFFFVHLPSPLKINSFYLGMSTYPA